MSIIPKFMKKLIISFLFILGISTIGFSNPLPNPKLHILNFSVQSEDNWSLTIDGQDIYNTQTFFDSLVITTSTDTAIYKPTKLSPEERDRFIHYPSFPADPMTFVNDSLNKPIKINPNGDKVVVTVYVSNTVFANAENKDSVVFGSYPNADFPVLGVGKSIYRIVSCGGNSQLYYDNGDKRTYTLKGKIYDKNGIPVVNYTFYKDWIWNYLPYPCMESSFQTDGYGNYSFKDTGTVQRYTKTDLIINANSILALRQIAIQKIYVSSPVGNIINQDIHLIDDLVDVKEQKRNNFSLFPNPTGNVATLNFDITPIENAIVEVFSNEGTLVESYPIKTNVGSLALHLDSKYHAGVYLVRVKTATKVLFSDKLIVNK
jgi:hypothetical protein